MIELVLVKKDMLCYVQDIRAVRGIPILYYVKFAWINRREVAVGARRISS